MKHYLVTEWNVDMVDIEWLEDRRILFESFCLPSVVSQSNKNFEWILVSDSRTPEEFKKVLESYPATILYHNFDNYEWNAPEIDGEMQRSVDLEYIGDILSDFIGVQKTDYVITSRCDNDDAINVNYIERIQRLATKYWDGKSFWLNLTRGMKWHNGYVYPKNSQSNPFISFIEPPDSLKTAYQSCHTLAKYTEYPVICVRSGEPAWMQVIHKNNLLNRVMRFKGKRKDDEVKEMFAILPYFGGKKIKING